MYRKYIAPAQETILIINKRDPVEEKVKFLRKRNSLTSSVLCPAKQWLRLKQ